MYKALREHQQAESEDGFTLIELLVVVIIIGILAAIAIPVFLNQRERAWRSAVQSDLRNAVVSMETHFTDAGDYDIDGIIREDTDPADNNYLTDYGYNPTDPVGLLVTTTADDQAYCLVGAHENNDEEQWYTGTGGQLSEDYDEGCPVVEAETATAPEVTFP